MATLDTLQTAVDTLTASTTSLLNEVNINKSTLTNSAASALGNRNDAAASASAASSSATSAASSASSASTSANSAANSATAASAVVLGNEPVRPSIRPSLLLDFANTKQLDPRITFTRASTATYYGTQTAKAEENLLLYSQPLNAGWTKIGTSVLTENNATAPDGTSTAALISCPVTSDYIYQVPATTIGLAYAFSFFVKNSTATISQYHVRTSGSAALGTLTWSGATLSSVTPTIGTASFVAVGNDWYRVSVFYTATETAARHRIAAGDTTTTTGNIFLWGVQLEQRSSVTAYTATTTSPITNYIPQLLTAAAGVPRFEHNPTTFESLGLEIEESRTNLWIRSEAFDNAAWAKTDSTVTADITVSPDGTVNGEKLVEAANTANHFISQNGSVTSGTAYTASFYAKKAERTECALLFAADGFSTATVDIFDLNTGTVITNQSGTAAITAVGNGWYRVSATRTATATVSTSFQIRTASAGITSYAGNGYSGIYIWGAQLEAGAFVTSYIPTVASQVTRAADAASMTGTNFSSWFNQAEGTMFADYLLSDPSSHSVAEISSTTSDYIRMRYASGAGAQYIVNVAGVAQVSQAPNGFSTSNTQYRRAITYATNSFNQAINGLLPTAEDTSGTVPVSTRLFIGAEGAGGTASFLGGTIKKLAYYPIRVIDAQLQAMTTV